MKKLLTFTCMGILLGGCGSSDEEAEETTGKTVAKESPKAPTKEPVHEELANAINFQSLTESNGIFYTSGSKEAYTGWAKQMHVKEKGKVEWVGQFKDGKPDGAYTSWYENGEKSSEGHFKGGEREGDWVFYEEDGSVEERRSY